MPGSLPRRSLEKTDRRFNGEAKKRSRKSNGDCDATPFHFARIAVCLQRCRSPFSNIVMVQEKIVLFHLRRYKIQPPVFSCALICWGNPGKGRDQILSSGNLARDSPYAPYCYDYVLLAPHLTDVFSPFCTLMTLSGSASLTIYHARLGPTEIDNTSFGARQKL